MPRRLLSLWLPHWRTALWHKVHPQIDLALPLALYEREGQSRKIIAANEAALHCGVQPGQFLATARSLVPNLVTDVVVPERDACALRKLAAWCRCFSPLVAVDAPDGLWIDSTGCAHLFGGEQAMLQAVKTRLMERGHVIRAALADTAGVAHALARYGGQDLTCVPMGVTGQVLDDLPIEALRLTAEDRDELRLMGIARIADLRAVPRASLTRRFGTAPLRRFDQAFGYEKEALNFDQPVTELHVKRSLVEPIGTAESIVQVMEVLCQEIAALLREKGLGARRLDLLCQRVDDVTQTVSVGTSEPVNDPRRLSCLMQERIGTIDPGFGIEMMSLHINHAEPRAPSMEKGDLAGATGQAEVAEMLVVLAERLRNRPGLQGIYHLAATADPFPEDAQQCHALPVLSRYASSWPRPTRLFVPPRAIAAPVLAADDSPEQFVWQDKTLRVSAAEGPERLHGAWWQHSLQAGAMRDYWIVETAEGERFWLFRRGDGVHGWSGDGSWFVHGLF